MTRIKNNKKKGLEKYRIDDFYSLKMASSNKRSKIKGKNSFVMKSS